MRQFVIRSCDMISLVLAVKQANAIGLVIEQTGTERGSVDELVNHLFSNDLSVFAVGEKDLDSTLLGKGSKVGRMSNILLATAPAHRLTNFASIYPRFDRTSIVFDGHLHVHRNALAIPSAEINQEINDKPIGEQLVERESPTVAISSFAELAPPSVVDSLKARGIQSPTPIQAAAMGRVLAGEDLVLQAETGSGKTLAFLLPVLVRLGLAGATRLPPRDEIPGRILMLAPTRELAVQTASEATKLFLAPRAVQVNVAGATLDPQAMPSAVVIVGTVPEMLKLICSSPEHMNSKSNMFLKQLRVIVLDEMDVLLPVTKTQSPRQRNKKKIAIRTGSDKLKAEELVLKMLEVCPNQDLQILGASATSSKPISEKMNRILRRDVMGRWFNKKMQIVRPTDTVETDLSSMHRAVFIPEGVRHYYINLRSALGPDGRKIKQKRLIPRSTTKLTFKQKQLEKERIRQSAGKQDTEGIHRLIESVDRAVRMIRPSSALVFLSRSSGLSGRRAARDMRQLGLFATALHEAIGLENGGPNSVDNGSVGLQSRHRELSESFAARHGLTAGLSEDVPLIVTFEEMARGLHVDAVDTVFILGMPDSPNTYLHLAGRTGRYPILQGNVVTFVEGSVTPFLAWSKVLGINFDELELMDLDSSTAIASNKESTSCQEQNASSEKQAFANGV